MPHMNIKQAADWAGVHRTTITRAIDSGKLSSMIDDRGRRVIAPAELSRVFQPASYKEEYEYSAQDALSDVVAARISDLQHALRTSEETIADLRVRLDKSEQERSTMLRLLEDQRADGTKRGWLARVRDALRG